MNNNKCFKICGILSDRISFSWDLSYEIRYSQFVNVHSPEINGGAIFINSTSTNTLLFGSYFFDCSSLKRGGSFCLYSYSSHISKTCSESCFLIEKEIYFNGNGGNINAVNIKHELSSINGCSPKKKVGNCCFALMNSQNAVAENINATNSNNNGYLFTYCRSVSFIRYSNLDHIDHSSLYIFRSGSFEHSMCNIINCPSWGFRIEDSKPSTLNGFVFQNNSIDIYLDTNSEYTETLVVNCKSCITDKNSFGNGITDSNCKIEVENPVVNNILRIGECIQHPYLHESNCSLIRSLRKIFNVISLNFLC